MMINGGIKYILSKLFIHKRIGGKYLSETVCLRWIRHLPKEEHKLAVKDFELRIKKGIILVKPKPCERMISLNPKKLAEIKKYLNGD